MKNLSEDFHEETMMGPGTDLVISLVAVLLVLMAIVTADFQSLKKNLENLVDLEQLRESNILMKKVKNYQQEIIQAIAKEYDSKAQPKDKDSSRYQIVVYLGKDFQDTINIYNDITLQRISFGEKILFDKGKYDLGELGKKSIYKVISAIKEKVSLLKEIQIQGHADNSGDDKDNLILASNRAIEVFEYMRNNLNISPINNLMSISSYGEYMPIQRDIEDTTFHSSKLLKANANEYLQSRNRRIEIVLNYKGNFIAKKNN